MKIARPEIQAVQHAQRMEGVRAPNAAQAAKPAAAAVGPDHVEFSPQALELAKARAALASVPEVRAEKVAELRQQVQTGDYKLPVEKLAKRLSALL
jgi:negative regulator of flagellin synthesis FlgM